MAMGPEEVRKRQVAAEAKRRNVSEEEAVRVLLTAGIGRLIGVSEGGEDLLQAWASLTGRTRDDAWALAIDEGLKVQAAQRSLQKAKDDEVKRRESLRADYVLVTATTRERKAFREAAANRGFKLAPVKGRLNYERLSGPFLPDVLWMQVNLGPFGSGGAAARCLEARAETGASTIILIGTAFGVPPSEIGDVLISSSICLYDDRIVSQEGGEEVMTLRTNACIAANKRLLDWAQRGQPDDIPMKLKVGMLLSGGAVIESAQFRDRLAEVAAKAYGSDPVVGGEMEAAGVVGSGAEWLIIKGVCDLADGATRDDEEQLESRQAAAARAAAEVVLNMLATPQEPTP